MISSVSIGASAAREILFQDTDGTRLEIEPGTGFQVTFSNEDLYISCRAGIRIETPWKPVIRLQEITYDIRTASHRVRAEVEGFDFFGLLAGAGEKTIAGMFEGKIRLHSAERY